MAEEKIKKLVSKLDMLANERAIYQNEVRRCKSEGIKISECEQAIQSLERNEELQKEIVKIFMEILK